MSILGACNKPLRQRCEEIANIIQKATRKELHEEYQALLDSIYGFNQQAGWGIPIINQQTFREEYSILRAFMSPSGPVMSMVYKLQTDALICRYEFPVAFLPAATRDTILDGAMPGFYANKLSYQTPGRPPSIMLNAFEYFVFCLAYLIIFSHKQQSFPQWTDSEDWLYPCLINDYLHYFLPVDGSGIPPSPSLSSPQSPRQGQGNCFPYRHPQYGVLYHYLYSGDTQHGQLFRSEQSTGNLQPQSLFNPHQTSSMVDSGNQETWRTETLLLSLGEFWLNQNALQSKQQGLREYIRENFIPSSDHVRVVRILVKHLHYFVNSAKPPVALSAYQQPEPDHLGDFKRYVIPQFIQKKLYMFLRHGFDNWPVDATFRQMLEVWLSYIQPWRYTEQTRAADRSPVYMREKDNLIQEDRWLRFVSNNLLFYTVLFQEYLPRAFRQDLSGAKNAILLFRVAKVFSQSNLPQLLEEAEQRLIGDYDSTNRVRSGSFGSSFIAPQRMVSLPSLESQLAQLETADHHYKPLFSVEGQSMIQRLLQVIHQAQMTVSNLNQNSVGNDDMGEGFFSSLFSLGMLGDLASGGHHHLQDDIGPGDTRKLRKYLEATVAYLCKIFKLTTPAVLPTDSMDGGSGEDVSGNHSDQPPHCINGQLSPIGRHQLMNGLRSFEVTFHGDPDLQPIRSFENAFLVRELHKIAMSFNNNFGDKISEIYNRTDFTGAVAKVLFAPPTFSPTHRHTPRKTLTYSPDPHPPGPDSPRLSLRFVASYSYLTKLFLFCLLLWWAGLAATDMVLILGFIAVVYTLIAGAMLYLRREPDSDRVDS